MPSNHGSAAWIYTSTLGGGFVDGDHISLNLGVGAGACAFFSTQASTKVYRSPNGSLAEMDATVDDDGTLLIVPDPVVCFAASRYRQVQRFEVAASGNLVLVDWISSGRRAAGERWAFAEYVSRTVVRYDGRLLLHDTVALREIDGNLATRLGRFDVLALVVLVGKAVRDEAMNVAPQVNRRPFVRRPDELVSVAGVGDVGSVVRIAGRSIEQVGRVIRQLLGFVPAMLGDDPWSRKW
jgi:urease accessory protein